MKRGRCKSVAQLARGALHLSPNSAPGERGNTPAAYPEATTCERNRVIFGQFCWAKVSRTQKVSAGYPRWRIADRKSRIANRVTIGEWEFWRLNVRAGFRIAGIWWVVYPMNM